MDDMDDAVLRPIEGSFDSSLFQPRYQRNNKRGGLKNLRCFPTCAAQHKERGFCGRPVFIKIKTDEGDNLLTWAEFLKSDEPKPINVGHTVSLPQAEEWSRSKEEPLKPWIKGTLASVINGVSSFEFNREKRGWHYGWTSNKHTCNASHILVAWIFERSRIDPSKLICRGVIESPPFMLFCRRRRRFTLVPSAPIAQPRSSKLKLKGDDDGEEFDEDDEEFEDDEEQQDEEEEEPIPVKVSKAKRKPAPTKVIPMLKAPVSSSSNKRTKLEVIDFPEFPSFSSGSAAGNESAVSAMSLTLDKNRVDALLSLLHLAWRKIKDDAEGVAANESSFTGGFEAIGYTGSSSAGAKTASEASGAPSIAAQTDTEFYQMLDFLSGELDIENITFDNLPSSSSGEPTAATSEAAEEQYEVDPDVEALAEYLLQEPDFRQSVLWLRGKGGHPDFNAFIGILRDHVYKYMRTRMWSIADIDKLIQNSSNMNQVKQEPGVPWFLHGGALNWDDAAASANSSGSPREFQVESYTIPNITGMWKQTRESQTAMEQVREKSGSSWVMSKLFEFMESKFTIQQNGLELSCRLWPMPALKFVLDGEEHPWGIRLPLFQPNWKYRAWTDGKVITLQHQIENRRLTRKYWCDPYRKFLYSEATLEVFDAFENAFIEESRVNQLAERVR